MGKLPPISRLIRLAGIGLLSLLLVACPQQPSSPDFEIALDPTSLTVEQGKTGTTTLTLTPRNGFTGQVALSLVNAPSGVSLSPTSLNVTGANPVSQALTLTVAQNVSLGNYSLQVRAQGGGIVREANLSLNVTAPPAPPTSQPPVVLSGTEALLTALPGESRQVTVRLAQGASGAEVYLRLADPCAQGRSSCPGWDASRYPGVEHTRERFALSATAPEATFTFSIAPNALPQGPFKWEVVAVDEVGKEWTFPVYLRVRDGDQSAAEALRGWRFRAGLPEVEEDPEWAWRGWLHSRYMAMNYPNELPHDEDLSQPFASEEGRSAGRVGNEWGSLRRINGQPYWPPDQASINWWIAAPFHRFNLVRPWPLRVGSGIYRDVGPAPGYGDGYGRSWSTFPNLSPWRADSPVREVLFPSPGMRVPLSAYRGRENPNPTYPCSNPATPPKRPFLTQGGLTWDDGQGRVRDPIGFPITLMTFAQADTEVLEARVTRVSDGAENPVCAYGSLQYWEDRAFWREGASRALRAYGAVVVFPHQPLTPGTEYQVYLKAQIGSQLWERTWRFQVEPEGSLWPLRLQEESIELIR